MFFPNIVGQAHAKKILITLFERKHFPPLIFVGPKGVGKRTTAITFAQIINCSELADRDINQCLRCRQIANLVHPDIKILFPLTSGLESDETRVLQEISNNIASYALSQTRPSLPSTSLIPIRAIRWINQEMSYRPLINQYKIIIIIDADRMHQEAANAFLKTLEEPQEQTLFILTTNRASAIIPTIRSRCQTIRFSSLSHELIKTFLIQKSNMSEPEAELASVIAEGSLRKALDFLNNKDSFFPNADLLQLFDQRQTDFLESLNLLLAKVNESALSENLLTNLLFIYRHALKTKLSIPIAYDMDIIKRITESLTVDQIVKRINFLLKALKDSEIHLNKKLSLFSLLYNLRF